MPVKFPYPRENAPVTCLAFMDWEKLERTKPIASSIQMSKIPRTHSLLGQLSLSLHLEGNKTHQLWV